MAWLWEQSVAEETEARWVVTPVSDGVRAASMKGYGAGAGEWCTGRMAEDGGMADRLIVRVAGEPERWALVGTATGVVRVNGVRLVNGIRILRDRDEIVANGKTEFFSAERIAEVEAFVSGERAVQCGRCQVEFEEGEGVVRCPGCARLYHENAARSCWQYRDGKCLFCEYPATLGGGFLWTPERI